MQLLAGSVLLYSQTREIPYHNWAGKWDYKSSPRCFIVNSQPEFREISNAILLNFDFENYTIIGVGGTSPGHFTPAADIRIVENTKEKRISIEVFLSGGSACENHCRVMKPSYRRVVYVSKINPEYEIEFKRAQFVPE